MRDTFYFIHDSNSLCAIADNGISPWDDSTDALLGKLKLYSRNSVHTNTQNQCFYSKTKKKEKIEEKER